ncbi:MAG: hypothetical protein OEU87_03710, partial [Nitrospira sp.]|nr:hypothetical protein [Nitrospira sp.]
AISSHQSAISYNTIQTSAYNPTVEPIDLLQNHRVERFKICFTFQQDNRVLLRSLAITFPPACFLINRIETINRET